MTGFILALSFITIALLLVIITILLRSKSPNQLPLTSLDPPVTPTNPTNTQESQALIRTLATVIQTQLLTQITNHTTAAIPLPDPEAKSRLIGREGRNIKTFERITGTTLLLDEAPNLAIISTHDPKRRQIACLTLQNLLLDARIHPQRIEEIFTQVQEDLPLHTLQLGQQAAQQLELTNIPDPILLHLGELAYLENQGQNVLQHSVETAQFATLIAQELNQDPVRAKTAALLHDIGKALPTQDGIPHALRPKQLLESLQIDPQVINAITAHHHNVQPTTLLDHIVIAANLISSQTLDARSAPLDNQTKANQKLESIALSFPNVSAAFAIYGGKELQVFIDPAATRDGDLPTLAKQIEQQAKQQLEYPGPVRIIIIRQNKLEHFNP